MILLLAILTMTLFALGFLNALWWLVAAALIFGYLYYGLGGAGSRHRGDGSEYGEYRDDRDHEDRLDRRYRRQRRGRWIRQERRDRQRYG
ncbi:hypothetical protein P8605_01610 [Streptomyces sp. T-3]|nr:hypothetical protein [Streptomyces sp. T-3]